MLFFCISVTEAKRVNVPWYSWRVGTASFQKFVGEGSNQDDDDEAEGRKRREREKQGRKWERGRERKGRRLRASFATSLRIRCAHGPDQYPGRAPPRDDRLFSLTLTDIRSWPVGGPKHPYLTILVYLDLSRILNRHSFVSMSNYTPLEYDPPSSGWVACGSRYHPIFRRP